MERRTTALVIAAVAVAMLAVGLVVNAVDDGGTADAAQASGCIDAPPLVAVDAAGPEGGGGLTVVRPDGGTEAVDADRVVTGADFTPDGTTLVVTRVAAAGEDYESGGPSSTAIWALALDGSAARAITEDGTVDSQPAVSPDGATVAFTRTDDAGRDTVWTVPFLGGQPRLAVSDDGADVRSPEWSPDGSRLAYVRAGAGPDNEVWTAAPDGSEARVAAAVADAFTIDWSPDGTQLLVDTQFTLTPPVVTLVDLGTGATRTVAEGAARPRWSRGGTQAVMLVEAPAGGHRLVERAVVGVDGADVSGGADRDLGVSVPVIYPFVDVAVARCLDR